MMSPVFFGDPATARQPLEADCICAGRPPQVHPAHRNGTGQCVGPYFVPATKPFAFSLEATVACDEQGIGDEVPCSRPLMTLSLPESRKSYLITQNTIRGYKKHISTYNGTVQSNLSITRSMILSKSVCYRQT